MKRSREEQGDAASFNQCLVPLEVLGRGAYGVVQKAMWASKDLVVAVKSCALVQRRMFQTERRVLERLQGDPFVVQLHGSFTSIKGHQLVLEYCPGGDLFTVLTDQPLLSRHAFFYTVELVHVLHSLHERHMVYGDLKLENVGIDKSGHIKLFDFGISSLGVSEVDSGIIEARGSELYMAPELFSSRTHGTAVDVWALGCVMLELYTVQQPTQTHPNAPLDGLVGVEPGDLDSDLRDLLQCMFHTDPVQRYTMKQVRTHKLFDAVCWKAVAGKQWDAPPFVPAKPATNPDLAERQPLPLY